MLLPSAYVIASSFIAFLIAVGFGLQIWNLRNRQIEERRTPTDEERAKLGWYILGYLGFGGLGFFFAIYATIVLVQDFKT